MAAKRLRKRKRPRERDRGSFGSRMESPEHEPFMLTCTGCGRKVEHTAHSCPECETVFHQRPGTRVRPAEPGAVSQLDPDVAEFSDRMDTIETWTRRICIVVGLLLALLTVVSALTGTWRGWRGAALLLIASIVCLIRGFCGSHKDLEFMERFGGFFPFYWRGWRR